MYRRAPGETRAVFNKIDLLNLPNPTSEVNKDAIKDKLNVLDFMFDDPGMVANDHPFSYWFYEGSMT